MPDFSHGTTIECEYGDRRRARIVARSVGQEIGEIDDERSTTNVRREGSTVDVEIAAADLVALRAAGNTWLSLIDVAERTIDSSAAQSSTER